MDVTKEMDVDAVPLSGLFFYCASVETAIPAFSVTMADVDATMATTAVSGLSFFSSSAAADVAETVASANNQQFHNSLKEIVFRHNLFL